jgi:hypothetical protein
MNTSLLEVINFIEELSDNKRINPDSDIFGDVGVTGDDFHEMIEKYSKVFSVDISSYLWYFHTNEEGHNFGGLFITPPYKRVERIPVTPNLLHEFAITGKWRIEYPKHTMPPRRWDLLINITTIGIFIVIIIIKLLTK